MGASEVLTKVKESLLGWLYLNKRFVMLVTTLAVMIGAVMAAVAAYTFASFIFASQSKPFSDSMPRDRCVKVFDQAASLTNGRTIAAYRYVAGSAEMMFCSNMSQQYFLDNLPGAVLVDPLEVAWNRVMTNCTLPAPRLGTPRAVDLFSNATLCSTSAGESCLAASATSPQPNGVAWKYVFVFTPAPAMGPCALQQLQLKANALPICLEANVWPITRPVSTALNMFYNVAGAFILLKELLFLALWVRWYNALAADPTDVLTAARFYDIAQKGLAGFLTGLFMLLTYVSERHARAWQAFFDRVLCDTCEVRVRFLDMDKYNHAPHLPVSFFAWVFINDLLEVAFSCIAVWGCPMQKSFGLLYFTAARGIAKLFYSLYAWFSERNEGKINLEAGSTTRFAYADPSAATPLVESRADLL